MVVAVAMLIAALPGSAGAVPSGARSTIYTLGHATHVYAMTAGPEGDVWFGGYRGRYEFNAIPGPPQSGIVGKVTPQGEVTEFPTEHDRSVSAIAAGPDGALWFTETGEDGIRRMTTSGEFTTFALPASGTEPTAIASGPDGALWFVEGKADLVGRITTAGAIATFPLPAGSRPTRIVAGDRGDLWIAAPGTDSIERVEAATGAVTSFPIGGGTENEPVDLAVGPDGSVFFTQAIKRIGRLTPDGKVSGFPVAHPGRFIVAGRGGQLWFSTDTYSGEEGPDANGIASITPAGHATFGACTGECASPIGALTLGPDGAPWFGTEIRFVYGGGLSGLNAIQEAGFVGSFHPSPTALRVERSAPVRGAASAALGVACRRGTAGERCRGRLKLRASAPHGGTVRVGSVGFNLRSGEEETLRMHLTTRARRLLQAGPLEARVGPKTSLVGKASETVKILPDRHGATPARG